MTARQISFFLKNNISRTPCFAWFLDKNDDCLEKIPFIAVVAFILVLVGSSVAGGTLYKAFIETEDIFATNFISIPWFVARFNVVYDCY